MRRFEWILLSLLLVSTALLAMTPWWLMNPARTQTQSDIDLAFALRGGWNTVFSFTAFAGGGMLCLRRWLVGRGVEKLAALFTLFLIGLCAAVANINLIGEVFQPIFTTGFVTPAEAKFLTSNDLLLVYGEGETPRAYPLRLLGYHHLVEDEVGGKPLVATYDPFTRGAIVWKAELDGQPLQFTLAGIENQNFLMRDEQTGSWWRQATGESVAGSLRGRKLEALPSEVVTLAALAHEHPGAEVLEPAEGSVLLPSDPALPRQGLRAPEAEGPLDALTLVVGIALDGAAKAVPAEAIADGGSLTTTVGSRSVRIAREGQTFRAFELANGEPQRAAPVRVEYWFIWKRAFPETEVADR
jgi:hypothetical protein